MLFGCATDFAPANSSPGTTYGKIYVDTPEVYSRERLVNDRFQQDAWLRKKLEQESKQGFQGNTGTSSQRNTTFGLGLALPTGKKPKTAEASETTETPKTSQAPLTPPKPPALPKTQLEKSAMPGDVKDTPIEEFRDAMAYREEVRNEILENQLDDRHDIAGNTLYRLKFDATVLPHKDTSAYAMVEVTITGSPHWNVVGDDSTWQESSDVKESKEVWEARTGIRLPDWEFAHYLPGLDKATIEFYSRTYQTWVEDFDATRYSDQEIEDILFGPLQRYFDVSKEGPRENLSFVIEELRHCEYYAEETKRDKARKELIARGVAPEYLEAGTFQQVSTYGKNNENVEIQTTEILCVLTGLANFIWDFRDNNNAIYTYAVTPKERVQRVYGNTLAAGMAGVSVAAEQAGIGATLAHSNAREARANAIMRQPQLVGYNPKSYRSADAAHSGETTMGWLIGPRYKISSDPNGAVSFRHVPSQYTLTGIISVPSWWDELNLVTKTYWLDENGVEFTEEGQELLSGVEMVKGEKATITLPGHLENIIDKLDPKRRKPMVEETTSEVPDQLEACENGSVIIRGSQLWRSTVVTLGAQQADSISVLPNMKGIIATFNPVKPSKSGSADLVIWTSEGEENVRTILIGSECKTAMDL